MQRYITFIRNNKTREEFISTAKAPMGAHLTVLKKQEKKYPHPLYTVHTAYTEQELEDILETIRRWTGDKSTSSTTQNHLALTAFRDVV